MPRYWCHICNSFVHVRPDSMKCLTCDGEFIEIVQTEEPRARAAPAEPAPAATFQYEAGANNPNGQFQFNFFGPAAGNQEANGQAQNFGTFWQQMMQQFEQHAQRAREQAQQQQGAGNQQQQAAPGYVQMQFPLGQLFNFTGQVGSFQDLLGGIFNGAQQFGDYASDASMSNILDRLYRQHQARTGVPASKNIFETLPKVTFTKETATGECAICKCDWEKDDEGVELPCHHIYHEDCIKKWFESSNKCPMCRQEVATDDPEYEKERKERLAEQEANNLLRTSQHHSVPNAASASSSSSSTNTAAPQYRSPHGLTEEQERILDAISISSDEDESSMDLSADYSTAEESDQGSQSLSRSRSANVWTKEDEEDAYRDIGHDVD